MSPATRRDGGSAPRKGSLPRTDDGDTSATLMPPLTVAMMSGPGKGHMLPICALAEEVASRGFTVHVYSFDAFESDVRPIIEAAGAVFRPLPTVLRAEDKATPFRDAAMYKRSIDMSFAYMVEEWGRERPSAVVVDIFGSPAIRAARSLGIPTVMNCPVALSSALVLTGLPEPSTAFSALGFTLIRPRWTVLRLLRTIGPSFIRGWGAGARLAASTGLVLVNSFNGLEPTGFIPSNWVQTGPLVKQQKDLSTSMASSHPELSAWMDAAASEGVPIVYVSMGSHQPLNQWEVKTLYAGLERYPCRVVWSLPADCQAFLPEGYDTAKFWVSAWLPQPAIIAHPATHVAISHCGWGASTETIAAGVPILALPFMAEQPANAEILVRAGAALLLPKKIPTTILRPGGYREGDFSAERVASCIDLLLNDPRYSATAKALQAQASFEGGRVKAGNCIEWVARTPDSVANQAWDNPVLRMCCGHWTDLISLPLACVAGAVLLAGVWYRKHA